MTTLTDDWASEKAAELMSLILNPDVALDMIEKLIAEELRLADAVATERTFRECRRVA